MQNAAANRLGACPLSNSPMNQWVDSLIKQGSIRIPNRYFRFEIEARKISKDSSTQQNPVKFLGGFFVRNPTHVSQLVYQWGVKNGLP
jgi:hypothetical protein